MQFTKNLGFLLLAIYLIFIGFSVLLPNLAANIPNMVVGVLALLAGVFILIGK